jgi:glycosyltransferase involved in cell wall biosynthesis
MSKDPKKELFIIVTTVADSLPFFKGQINILKESFDVELVSSKGYQLDDMCKFHSILGHEVEMKREISVINDFYSLIKLILLFSHKRPHIVHGNTPKAGLLSMIAAWILKVPKRIYYVHGLRYHGESNFKRKVLICMEKISCMLATDVIAVSQGIKNALIDDNISSKNIKIIGNGSVNGLNLNYFDPQILDSSVVLKNYVLDHEDFIFGFVGRLVADKGINELVSAFKRISKVNSRAKLLLIGNYESELDPLQDNTVNEILNNSNIIHAGFQKDVRPFFKAMDVFVFPSYREGFGIVLMEASAMNVPSISSNIIGCNEIIIEGSNGFLINSKDEAALFEKMNFCIENPSVISQMATSARNLMQKFEQQEFWRKSLRVYENISKN